MAYDDVLLHIGEFGRYQRRIYLLLFLPAIISAFHLMAGVFLGAQPDFRCILPYESSTNATYQLLADIMDVAYPWDDTTESWSRCERYDLNFTNQYYDFDGNFPSTNSTVKCNAFVYDKTTYELTTTTEFNLVCNDAWLKAAMDSLFMVGIMFGSLIFSGLSDKYGRKPIFGLALTVNLIGGSLVAVSPDTVSYMISRLILGTSVNAMYLIAYVSAIEMASPRRRLMVSAGLQLGFSSGYVLSTALAYFITNWRIFQVALTIPSLVVLSYWCFIPESVRWLLSKNRLHEAKALILKASSENGVELSEDKLDDMLSNGSASLQPDLENASMVDLFRYPNLRRKSLLLIFNWFVNTGIYFGLSWNTSSLGGNDYVNYAIAGLVEIPACALVFLTLNRWGRRNMFCGYMIFAGVSLLLTIFVPADMQSPVIVLAMIGKMAITTSIEILYIFTAEQYPTVVRNVGVGTCATFAKIGGVIAPYIIYLSGTWRPLPYVIFGSSALIGGLSGLLLPETLNEKLPESIKDGEEFGNKKSTTAKKEFNDS